MAGKRLGRRVFLKYCGAAAIGSTLALQPYNLFATGNDKKRNTRFKLSKPNWIIYDNGSYDLISEEIILKNCRPAIDGQTVMPKNVFLGDSPKGKRIVYELPGGFLMLDLKTDNDSISIGTELSGFSRAPRWFYPISQAEIYGAQKFYIQSFGTGGKSGIYQIEHSSEKAKKNSSANLNWSMDSFLSFGFLGKEETIAVGNIDHNDFLQRSTIYNKLHRTGLTGNQPGDEQLFFESAMKLDEIKIENEYIKLPELHFYAGNKPLETLQELAWQQSEKTGARQGSATSYHWIYSEKNKSVKSLENLKEHVNYIRELNPPLSIHTISIDQGYCCAGDWLEMSEQWPGGADRAAREIFKNGYRAGIWTAPFVVAENSKLFKQHPDWVVKDYNDNPIPEKTGKPGNFYALDISHNDVLKHLSKVFKSFRKAGFIFYETAHLDAGFKDSKLVKKANPGKTAVQEFRNALGIIREEIGSGSLWVANHTPFSPVIGFADIVKVGNPVPGGWDKNVENMINESYLCQYFNNILWQNDPGPLLFSDTSLSLSENEKTSLALWNGILGGAVSGSANQSFLNNEQLNFFRFLEPNKRFKNAYFPFWPDVKEIKIAVREYRSLRSWGILFLNDKDTSAYKSFSVADLVGENSVYVFSWKPQDLISFGELKEIDVNLQPHESKLFYVSRNNEAPPGNLSLAGNILEEI